jgi:hypothetical protein
MCICVIKNVHHIALRFAVWLLCSLIWFSVIGSYYGPGTWEAEAGARRPCPLSAQKILFWPAGWLADLLIRSADAGAYLCAAMVLEQGCTGTLIGAKGHRK